MLTLRQILLASATFALLCFGSATAIRADTFTLTASDSGSYFQTGFHNELNPNYIVGQCASRCFLLGEYRNFFVFDLSGVSGTVTGATLRLFNPADGFLSPDPSELYSLFDVSTPVDVLRTSHPEGSAEGMSIFADLGGGTTYGSVTATAAIGGTIVEINLNAAGLAAIMGSSGGQFAIGGAITTLRPLPSSLNEYIFGNSGAPTAIRQLVVTTGGATIPEPTTVLLLGTGLAAVGAAAARKKRGATKSEGA